MSLGHSQLSDSEPSKEAVLNLLDSLAVKQVVELGLSVAGSNNTPDDHVKH